MDRAERSKKIRAMDEVVLPSIPSAQSFNKYLPNIALVATLSAMKFTGEDVWHLVHGRAEDSHVLCGRSRSGGGVINHSGKESVHFATCEACRVRGTNIVTSRTYRDEVAIFEDILNNVKSTLKFLNYDLRKL